MTGEENDWSPEEPDESADWDIPTQPMQVVENTVAPTIPRGPCSTC